MSSNKFWLSRIYAESPLVRLGSLQVMARQACPELSRRAHHERPVVSSDERLDSNTVHPELVEGRTFLISPIKTKLVVC